MVESKSTRGPGLHEHDLRNGQDPDETSYAAGALFGRQDPGMSGSTSSPWMPFPRDTCGLLQQRRPGVIGNIGTTMGKSNVNIAGFPELNREQAE